jgi:hypothetical protein
MKKNKKNKPDIKFEIECIIGTILYKLGFKYGVCTCIGEWLEYGYGRCDENGFWQFPCYPKQ